jgi:DNA-binding CsgD family transcriptional regulator
MKQTNLRAHIRHLCCIGLPSETLMPRLLPLVRELVPADSAGFFWVDSTGHMQNLVAERMLTAPKMRLYFDHFYAGGKYDFRESFKARAANGKTVAISETDAAFRESAYYNEILKDLDAHHVLYGIVRDQSEALGQLSLYRGKADAPFSERDQEALSSIMHYINHAVAAPLVEKASVAEYIDSNDDAVILVDASGNIQHASEQGKRLAVQAAGGAFAPDFSGVEDIGVKGVLAEVVGRLSRGEIPQITKHTHWGRIQLRAYYLGDVPTREAMSSVPIAVRITRQEPMILRFARSLQAIDLPPQQQEVAMLLARGLTNQEISTEMSVSVNTVAYHIKQLFSRLEAHGRAELIERVIAQSPTQ